MNYWQSLKRLNRNTRRFLLSYILALFANFGIYGVIFNLYLLRLDYGSEFVGVANSIRLLNMAVLALPAGWIGKRVGARTALIVGLLISLAAASCLPLAEILSDGWRSGWIIVTYGIFGLGNAFYLVNSPPFLMTASAPEVRNVVFSAQAAGGSLAAFLGNLIAGFLPGLFSRIMATGAEHPAPFRYTLLIPPLLYLLSLLFCSSTRAAPAKSRGPALKRHSSKLPLLVISAMSAALLLRMVGETSARVFFNVHMDLDLGASTGLIGTVSAVAQLIAIPAALLMPMLTRRLGRRALFTIGLCGMSGSLFLMGLVPHWSAAGLAFIGISAMHSVVGPTSVVFQQEVVPFEWREVISGATTMAIGIGSSGISFSGGFILSAFGSRILFLSGAVSVAAGAALFWLFFRRPRGEYAPGI